MSPDVPFDVAGRRVLVTGLHPHGFAAADALLERGARVTVLRPVASLDAGDGERARILDTLGASLVEHPDPAVLPALQGGGEFDLVVLGGYPEADQSLLAALPPGVDTCVEVELAWRMRPAGAAAWLVVGGDRRRSVVAELCARMLAAAGLDAAVAGGQGLAAVEALRAPKPPQVLVVDVDPWQAQFSSTVSPFASLCLTAADPRAVQVYRDTVTACLYSLDDPSTERGLREADVVEGCRAVGVGRTVPGISMLGLVEEVLCDRAFHAQRQTSAAEIATLDDVAACFDGLVGPEQISWVLGAAGLARAVGVAPGAVRAGLRAGGAAPADAPQLLGRDAGGLPWVWDAGADSPPAAEAALTCTGGDVVWVAAGWGDPQTSWDDLLSRTGGRLAGVVVVDDGRGGAPGRVAALARHAPDVPVRTLALTDTGVVSAPAALAESALAGWASTLVETAAELAGRDGERAAAVVAAGAVPVRSGGSPTLWGRVGQAFADAVEARLAGEK